MTLKEINKKYKDVIDLDLALATDKQMKKYTQYLDERNLLNNKKEGQNHE
jgi:hypothetical protein